ncbi:hypothetical protein FHR81_004447 [Actinoalloteichus hoggarensis]|nr:nuclear transport factor 2 family protein [Actinoalloteichus hoggarensis]MBB5923376.1 hypothetical protein [Actinoalloteichus hoggarensis]
MSVLNELLAVEKRLAHGSGDDYAEVLHDDALVIVPGAVLDRAQCIAAMNSSPGWDETAFSDTRLIETVHTATVAYTFTGRRDDATYSATLASTYLRRDGDWRLLVHQQTPR